MMLIIDEATRQRIAEVVQYAEAHTFSLDDLLDVHNQEPDAQVAGDMEDFVCYIPLDYRVVYSIEDQPIRVRHLSISVSTPGRLPSVAAVAEIMRWFGFVSQLSDCMVQLEAIGPDRQAVNVWEEMGVPGVGDKDKKTN
jgi:hypothetical protein